MDMALKGWNGSALAREAHVSEMTVSRFLTGQAQTAPTASKIAKALGRPIRRYLVDPAKVAA